MRVKVYGRVDEPAVAVVGSWDPLLPGHVSLFRRLRRYARHHSLASVVIHLEPSPARHLNGALEWPTYDDVRARLAMVAASGISASLLVRFRKQDLTAGAKEFIEAVTQHVKIDELWLGAQQSLGSCEGGSDEAIQQVAKKHRITIARLPYSSLDGAGRKVREFLILGQLEQAVRIVGRSPVWSRPRSGFLRLPWRPGNYVAAPLSGPGGKSGKCFHLQLTGSGHIVPKCVWPDPAMSWLTFFRRAEPKG
jgi:FAD synthase